MSSTASAPPPVNEPPPPAAVVPAGGIHSISVPTAFTDNPVGFLSSIAARPPSRPGLEQLGGTIAAWISEQCHLAQASAGGGPFSGHQKEATEAEHKQQVAAAAEEGKQHSDNHAIGNSDMEFVLIAMEYLRAAGVQLIATVSPPSAAMASPTTAISASGNVLTTTTATTNTNTSSSSSSAMHAALDATTVALQTTVVTVRTQEINGDNFSWDVLSTGLLLVVGGSSLFLCRTDGRSLCFYMQESTRRDCKIWNYPHFGTTCDEQSYEGWQSANSGSH